jgi:hypothetical protein
MAPKATTAPKVIAENSFSREVEITIENNGEQKACTMPGCVGHATRKVTVDEVGYEFQVHFSSTADMLVHATESVSRKVAAKIRAEIKDGEKISFPTGRIVDIDSSVKFARTIEDDLRELENMTPEQRAAKASYFKAMLEAVMKAQAVR